MPGKDICGLCIKRATYDSSRIYHYTGTIYPISGEISVPIPPLIKDRGGKNPQSESSVSPDEEEDLINQILGPLQKGDECVLPVTDIIQPDHEKIIAAHQQKAILSIDDLFTLNLDSRTFVYNDDRIRKMAETSGCDPRMVRFIAKHHVDSHLWLHKQLKHEYATTNKRIIEHYTHYFIYYLIERPKLFRMPSKMESDIQKLGDQVYYAFRSIHALQPPEYKADDADFEALYHHSLTWVLETKTLKYVKDFDTWHTQLFRKR